MRSYAAVTVLVLLAGCAADQNGPGAGGAAHVSFVNGARNAGALSLYVDGSAAGSVQVARQGSLRPLSAGDHLIEARTADGSLAFSRHITARDGAAMTLVAFDSAGLVRPAVIDDSNSVVPAGASKLRVAHLASSAGSIDIWRTQPDYATPIRIMFPFNFQNVSPFVQSTPGAWRILVSTAISDPTGPMPDTLAMTGPVQIGGGQARTVVVLDKEGGGVEAMVVEPQGGVASALGSPSGQRASQ